MNDLDSAWLDFCCEPDQTYSSYIQNDSNTSKSVEDKVTSTSAYSRDYNASNTIPKCSDIYISTKTQIAHLNQAIDLHEVFWKLPIIPYYSPKEGILKKQMKFNSNTKEELDSIQKKIPADVYIDEHIISHIENPGGRIPFKDTRKISIGLKKSDITNSRCKKKGAFYNCFVIIIRLLYDNKFKEVHVKVFNTGKLEIPGIKDDDVLKKVLDLVICCLSKYVLTSKKLTYNSYMSYTVLINSNFNCGYYVNRAKLYEILRNKYKLNGSYDSCSYPGIQSLFYYNTNKPPDEQTGQQPEDMSGYLKVSFMVFRTGSALIVGKCDEYVVKNIYGFLVNMFAVEYEHINCGKSITETTKKKVTAKKKRFVVSITCKD